jgi:hypothetical protein
MKKADINNIVNEEVSKIRTIVEEEVNEYVGIGTLTLMGLGAAMGLRVAMMPDEKLQQAIGATKSTAKKLIRALPIIGDKIKQKELKGQQTDAVAKYLKDELTDQDVVDILKSNPKLKKAMLDITTSTRYRDYYDLIKGLGGAREWGYAHPKFKELRAKIKKGDLNLNESFKKGDKVKFVGEKSIFKNLDPNRTYTVDDVVSDTDFDDVRYVVDQNPLKADDLQLAESVNEYGRLQEQTEKQKKQKVYTKADIDEARAAAASDSRDPSGAIAKIPEGPKLIQACGDELAEMIKPNSSIEEDRSPQAKMAEILSDPLNSTDNESGFAATTMPRVWRNTYTDVPIINPAFLEKHQKEIIRIAVKSPKNIANQKQAKMTDFSFQYPNTAFKNKAAELLDAMEIDMLDNFDDYEDWTENGMTSPNREVEDLTDELIALDKNGQAEYDDWMEHVALPFIKKNNNSINEAAAPPKFTAKEFVAFVNDEFDAETLQLMQNVLAERLKFLDKMKDLANPRTVVQGYMRKDDLKENLGRYDVKLEEGAFSELQILADESSSFDEFYAKVKQEFPDVNDEKMKVMLRSMYDDESFTMAEEFTNNPLDSGVFDTICEVAQMNGFTKKINNKFRTSTALVLHISKQLSEENRRDFVRDVREIKRAFNNEEYVL